jgi:hypothetical protein
MSSILKLALQRLAVVIATFCHEQREDINSLMAESSKFKLINRSYSKEQQMYSPNSWVVQLQKHARANSEKMTVLVLFLVSRYAKFTMGLP